MQNITPSLERMVINDALFAEPDHWIDIVDPGYPHSVCYTVRFGKQIIFASRTTGLRGLRALLGFLDAFRWEQFGYSVPTSRWYPVESGGSNNPIWELGIRSISLPNADWLSTPSPHTGALKRQVRIRVQDNQSKQAQGDELRSIEVAASKVTPAYTLAALLAVYQIKDAKAADKALIRVDALKRATLGDMTLADLYAEGYTDRRVFNRQFRGQARPDTPVWVLHVTPVFERPKQYKPSILTPALPVQADTITPLQASLWSAFA